MNTKILLAFVGGLIFASGITYVVMKPSTPTAPAAVAPAPAAATPQLADITATTAPDTTTAAQSAEAAPAAPETLKPSAAVRKEAPKPRRKKVVTETVADPPREAPEPERPAQKPVETASNSAPAPLNIPPASTLAPPPGSETAKPEPPPPPTPHTVTIPGGTLLSVRLGETLSTQRSRAGDTFSATLDQPLIVDGFVIADRGAKARGRVVESDPAGRVRGLAQLGVELTELNTSDGQRIRINTAAFRREAESTKKKDAAKVGIGAALGAAIGAIAGGGKGAAIGAGVGGAAGAGTVMMTRGDAVEIPVETRLSFRLAEPVTITEQLH
jgi:hypothetical protein